MVMRILLRICIIIIYLFALPAIAHADKINRNILAVLDSSEIKDEFDDLIHIYAEMPLNHLGYKLDYVDVTKRLPDDQEMRKYHGIISWFTDNELKNATDYVRWLTRQVRNGKKLVILDEPGFDFDDKQLPTPIKYVKEFYAAYNISYTPYGFTSSPHVIELIYNDSAMTEFERPLGTELATFLEFTVRDPRAKVFLKLRRRDSKEYCDAVFTHSKGGVALTGYVYYQNPQNFQTRWRLNPFKFFARAFGSAFPKPDVTTINGMRLMYSHIDGDGIRNLSRMDSKPCPLVLYNKILTQYKLPITVSVVIGDIMTAVGISRKRLINTIKKIFLLPNVQTASHGWSHPFVWEHSKRKLAFKLKHFTYSPAAEIGGSIEYINKNLAPPDKKTHTFFWTGDCLPDYDALKYVYDHGILNLNGGDTRFDSEYPSYTYVAPLYRHVGDLLQYFTANSNENIYTGLWTGPFYGFKQVIETYENTDKPIRVRPIDVYYHFYLMERKLGYESLVDVYNWILRQEITPVFANHYIDVMTGFVTTEIQRLSDNRWTISNNGTLHTMRFDDERRYVDLARSKGVLGFVHHQGSLYVHLDNGERSEITLSDARPTALYVAKANGTVSDWKSTSDGASFTLHTIGRIHFQLASLKPGRNYRVTVNDEAYRAASDANGDLIFYIELPSRQYEEVKIVLQ